MSPRLAWARNALQGAHKLLSAWDLSGNVFRDPLILALAESVEALASCRLDTGRYRDALLRISVSPEVERCVACFGGRFPYARSFVQHAEDPDERSVKKMMFAAAFAFADPTCRVVKKSEAIRAREKAERALSASRAGSAESARVRLFLATQAPLDDPILISRQGNQNGRPNAPSNEDYAKAQGVLARMRGEARGIFLSKSDADATARAFSSAATGVPLTNDVVRGRRKISPTHPPGVA